MVGLDGDCLPMPDCSTYLTTKRELLKMLYSKTLTPLESHSNKCSALIIKRDDDQFVVLCEFQNKSPNAPNGNECIAAALIVGAERRVEIECWCSAVVWVACHQHIMPKQLWKSL